MNTKRHYYARLAALLLVPSMLLAACGKPEPPRIVSDLRDGVAMAEEAHAAMSEAAEPTRAVEPAQAGGDDRPAADTKPAIEPFQLPLEAELPRSVTYSGLEWTVPEAAIDNVRLSLFGDSDELTDDYRVARITLKIKNPLPMYANVDTGAVKLQIGDGDPIGMDDSHPLTLPAGNETKTSKLAFVLPEDATWKDARLVIGEANLEPAILPLEGPMPVAEYPATLAAGGGAAAGNVEYALLGASLDLDLKGKRANMGERFLKLRMRVTYNGGARLAVTSDTFRLEIDGVPMAPEQSMMEVVSPNSAKEGEVVFVVPATLKSAELRVGEDDETAIIPLDVQAAKP